MMRIKLQSMTVDQLVERFVAIALEQDEAELMGDTHKFSPLFWQMEAVEEELKARPGDQRRVLLSLYDHSNAQVRVKAAKAALALAPQAARRTLQIVADSHCGSQSLEAGMSLVNLDRGIFKPH